MARAGCEPARPSPGGVVTSDRQPRLTIDEKQIQTPGARGQGRRAPYGGRTSRRGMAECPGPRSTVTDTVATCHPEASPPDPASRRPSASSVSAARRAERARLARRLTEQQLAAWGLPCDSANARVAVLVTAELASNAITHGRLSDAVRIEVTDARPQCLLHNPSPARPPRHHGGTGSAPRRRLRGPRGMRSP